MISKYFIMKQAILLLTGFLIGIITLLPTYTKYKDLYIWYKEDNYQLRKSLLKCTNQVQTIKEDYMYQVWEKNK